VRLVVNDRASCPSPPIDGSPSDPRHTLTRMTKQPAPGYYETAAAVITTLYVALAIEFRLLRRRDEPAELPTERTDRVAVIIAVVMFLAVLLGSAAGLIASLSALQSGSSTFKATTAEAGTAMLIATFVIATTDTFFGLLAQALPSSVRRRRRPILVAVGLALIGFGLWLIVG
jgi:hypothetical protein